MGIVPENKAKVKPGQRFTNLTILGRPFSTDRKSYFSRVVCQCDCGVVLVVFQNSLLARVTRSCGCYNRSSHTKHGMSRSRLYRCWEGMRARCYRKTETGYHRYGGRGISVGEQWRESFEEFAKWALSNGYEGTKTLDRINGNGNYEPSNCRWATSTQQNRNRRVHRRVSAFGETKLLCEWAEDARCAVKLVTLKYRLRSGWSPERAITQRSRYEGSSA